jgi:hypothetical protein
VPDVETGLAVGLEELEGIKLIAYNLSFLSKKLLFNLILYE